MIDKRLFALTLSVLACGCGDDAASSERGVAPLDEANVDSAVTTTDPDADDGKGSSPEDTVDTGAANEPPDTDQGDGASATSDEGASTNGVDFEGGTSDPGGGQGEPGAAGDESMPGEGGDETPSTRSAGCGQSVDLPSSMVEQTLSVDGTTRYYLAYVPPSYDPDVPLDVVFAFHGLNMNNYWAAHDQSGFRLIAESAGQVILVYPQGSGDVPETRSQWGNINWVQPEPDPDSDR